MTTSSTTQEPRWRRLPEERPQQIVEAALEVFGEHGLGGARLEDIAKRAGISKGTIYLYFTSKEDLFREVVRKYVIDGIDAFERGVHGGSATDQLVEYMRGYWSFLRSPSFQTIYRLVNGELHQFPDLAAFYGREVVSRACKLVAGIIARGTKRGEFRQIDPQMAARMLASMFVTNALWCGRRRLFAMGAELPDDETMRDELMDFFLHAIRPAPEAAAVHGSRK